MTTPHAGVPGADAQLVRGGMLLMASKLVHILAGFGLYFFLLMILTASQGEVGGTQAFGVWGTTLVVINPINMMFATGTLQMISQLVASRGALDGRIFYRAARTQIGLMLVFAAAFQLAAPTIATGILNDPKYAPYLRLGGLIPIFYTLRCLYQGYLNARRRFADQAWLDIGSSSLRMLFVLAGAALGWGALGAIGGFVLSAFTMTLVAATWIRPRRGEGRGAVDTGEIYAFQVKVLLVTLATSLLTSVDAIAVKALAAADPLVADRYAGYYTGSQKLAQIPMSLVVALAYLMFPYVAKGSTAEDGSEASQIVSQGMRTLLLLIVPCTAVLASAPHETLTLVFGSLARAMVQAGDPKAVVSGAFPILALGYALYSVFLTSTTLITAGGRPGTSLAIILATLAASAGLARGLVPVLGPPGAALAVSLAWAGGLCACVGVLLRRHGRFVAPASLARILGCGAATWGLGVALPVEGLALVAKDALLVAFFAVAVVATREVRVEELARLVRLALGGKPV